MRLSLSVVSSTLILFALSACESDSDRALRGVEDQLKTLGDTLKEIEATRDALTIGGQPGSVRLSGAIVVDESKGLSDGLNPLISVEVTPGTGAKGAYPELKSEIMLSESLTPDQEELLAELELGKYVNFGCDLSTIETEGLTEEHPGPPVIDGVELDLPIQVVTAEAIFICDFSLFYRQAIQLTAKTMLLSGVDFQIIEESFEGKLSILAESLIFDGENSIEMKAPVRESLTIHAGPDLSLAAKNILGDGTLNVISVGSSYVEPTE